MKKLSQLLAKDGRTKVLMKNKKLMPFVKEMKVRCDLLIFDWNRNWWTPKAPNNSIARCHSMKLKCCRWTWSTCDWVSLEFWRRLWCRRWWCLMKETCPKWHWPPCQGIPPLDLRANKIASFFWALIRGTLCRRIWRSVNSPRDMWKLPDNQNGIMKFILDRTPQPLFALDTNKPGIMLARLKGVTPPCLPCPSRIWLHPQTLNQLQSATTFGLLLSHSRSDCVLFVLQPRKDHLICLAISNTEDKVHIGWQVFHDCFHCSRLVHNRRSQL